MMAEVALDQKIGTLLRMHEEVFRQIGGVPEEILYDRMKTVWLGSDERGEIADEVDVLDGRARIAAHVRARRKYEVVTFPAHHQGIPLGARRAEGKILVHIRQSAPVVEKRSLLAYESAANGGGR
jgi:hypothetical protein